LFISLPGKDAAMVRRDIPDRCGSIDPTVHEGHSILSRLLIVVCRRESRSGLPQGGGSKYVEQSLNVCVAAPAQAHVEVLVADLRRRSDARAMASIGWSPGSWAARP
jgi:hypothetical protein